MKVWIEIREFELELVYLINIIWNEIRVFAEKLMFLVL